MQQKYLKKIRVTVSLIFFILTVYLFLDFHNIYSTRLADKILFFQFVPSVLEFLHGVLVSGIALAVVLTMTFLFGRVYCSTVCPLGTLQDLLGFLRGKKRRRGYKKSIAHNRLRIGILVVTVLLLFAGSGVLLNLLDPFSAFGRIVSNLVRPLVIIGNNFVAVGLEQFGIYALVRKQWAAFSPFSVGVSAGLLLLISYLTVTRGRLYCSSICPVGTLLGICSKRSLVHIGISVNDCTGCKRCESVCKAGCIDLMEMTVDMSRCVGCYNCLTVCSFDAIRLKARWNNRKTDIPADQERRTFLMHSGVSVLGLAGLTQPERVIVQSKPTTIPEAVTCPTSPPGCGSVSRFNSICSACHLCVSVCPSRVLTPAFIAYGVNGIMQPRMDFRAAHCNYECTVCTDVCPTGALQKLTVEEKKLTQIGVSKFIKENCVVYTDNTTCGACSEHCPTKAVKMVPYQNPLNKPLVIPELNTDVCIGCGGCEHACPTKPFKAIYVDGNPQHKIAKKPEVQQVDQNVDFGGDFPF